MESLVDALSSSPWTYALLLAFAAFDALVPVFPSETAAIAAGVLAAAGDLNITFVVAAAAGGAFIGDISSYVVGRTAGRAAVGRLMSRAGAGGLARLAWAGRVLEQRGSSVIVFARFVPGGRTAATLTAGLISMSARAFLLAAAAAAILWASFAAGLGYVGGRALQEEPWRALVAAAALAVLLLLGVEVARRLRRPGRRLCISCRS
jgi:membrane protein DedA with SNARE-associated domain